MPRTDDGRAFTGQYRIDAQTRPEGVSLRLSLDADLLLRLVADTGGPSLELAGVVPRDTPALSWQRNRLGIVMALLGLAVAVGSLLWPSAPPRERAYDAAAPAFTLPQLPPPAQPSALAQPEPPRPPPPAPAVIRLDPVPEAPAPAAATPVPPAVERARAAPAPPPAPPKAAAPPAAPKPRVEPSATPTTDVLDLFDDTK